MWAIFALLFASTALAAPATVRRDDTTLLTAEQVSAWTNPAWYASAAYCPGYSLDSWDCGPACDSLARPSRVIHGGDGEYIPRWFVAQLSDAESVISISGTNTSSLESVAIDLEFPLVRPRDGLFPGSKALGIQLHAGFLGAFERMRDEIDSALSSMAGSQVTVVGHSLGGALGTILGAYLARSRPQLQFTVKVFGTPRVGNSKWADYVEASLGGSLGMMINFADNVPHVPPREWLYSHPAGEVFISQDGTEYKRCAGRENKECARGLESVFGTAVRVATFIQDLDFDEHLGPYAGVNITSRTCNE